MIYLVTHGEKESGANPGLTQKGKEQIATLKSFLPKTITRIVCGTGRRHLDVAKSLSLVPDQYTSLVGEPDSLELDENKKPWIRLADGTMIPEEKLTTLFDNELSALILLKTLPDDTIVCTGRPLLIMLGKNDAKSGCVYSFDKNTKVIIRFENFSS